MKDFLRSIWKPIFAAWMRFAHVLGIINTTILLTLVYLLMIIPLRLLMTLVAKDPLHMRSFERGPVWQQRDAEPPAMEERRHPF